MKYIDADRLRAEIERRKKEHMYNEMPITIGRYYEDRDLLAFIDFDLQEQPEEDEDFFFDEVLKVYDDNNKYPPRSEEELTMLETIARHFYKLGKEDKK